MPWRYFTAWNLLLVLAGPREVARASALATAAAGFYLSHVHPQRIDVYATDPRRPVAVVRGPNLWLADLLVHQAPLLALLLAHRDQCGAFVTVRGVRGALLAFAIYAVALRPGTVAERYGLTGNELDALAGAILLALLWLV